MIVIRVQKQKSPALRFRALLTEDGARILLYHDWFDGFSENL